MTSLDTSGTYLNPGIIGCLPSRRAGHNGEGLERNNRRAARDAIDASPAVAHPDDAREDILRHVSAGLELAALVGNHNGGLVRDVPLVRIQGMYPELRPRVGSGQCWERLAFIKEGMESREGASLTETQGIRCSGGRGIGRQRREPGLASALQEGPWGGARTPLHVVAAIAVLE